MMSGESMRTSQSWYAQPRPKVPQASKCALTRPHLANWSRVHSLAFFMLGEPVRRGPMSSVRWLIMSITSPWPNSSSRKRVMNSRSGISGFGIAGAAASAGGVSFGFLAPMRLPAKSKTVAARSAAAIGL
jgi:hypothetical protein